MSYDDIVSAPPPSGGIDWKDLKGRLLVIKPSAVERGIQTQYGVSDAVRADVVALIGPGEVSEHNDTLVFPKVLQGQLRGQLGNTVVGRLAQGQAKGNQDPPWVLDEATADDLSKARDFLSASKPAVASAAPPW